MCSLIVVPEGRLLFGSDPVTGQGEGFVVINAPVKTTGLIGVAGGADRIALEHEGIAITIDANILYVEHIAGRFALKPQGLAGT